MRRADGRVTAPITRCTACGAWVWLIDHYGCSTCIRYWALHGVTTEKESA
jgi:hypothetical protein